MPCRKQAHMQICSILHQQQRIPLNKDIKGISVLFFNNGIVLMCFVFTVKIIQTPDFEFRN